MEETKETTAEATGATVEVTPTGEAKVNVELMKETTMANGGAQDEEVTARAEKEETVTSEESSTKSPETNAKQEVEEEKEEAPKKKKKRQSSITPEAPSRTSKRSRKQTNEFKPDNFMAEKDVITIIEGRGMKCEDIPNVQEKIESHGNNSEEIVAAHKLIFRANIGKPASNHRKEHLLAFSGYLPPLVEGEDEEERDKSDEKIETKMSQKAYKLKVSELKMICDLFDVNRSPSTIDKDKLIDRLLDFLSAPDPKHTNKSKSKTSGSAKKKKKSGKAKKKQEEDEDEESEEEEEESSEDEASEEEEEDELVVSKKALRKWVKAYVVCFDIENVTTAHAYETASSKFGVEIKGKTKEALKQMLIEEM